MSRSVALRLIAASWFMLIACGCAQGGRVVSMNELEVQVSQGRLGWYYRGSDEEYHYLAVVTGIPVPRPLPSERREYYRVKKPDLDSILSGSEMPINHKSRQTEEWKRLKDRRGAVGLAPLENWQVE